MTLTSHPNGVGATLDHGSGKQYGCAGEGVCLTFDREAFVETISAQLDVRGRFAHAPVRYENRFMREEVTLNLDLPPEQVIDDIVTQHLAALFFTKNTDWASEHEYRFTVETPDEEWTYLSVAGTLRDIVMGPDVSEADSLALWRQVQRLRGVGDDVHLTALNWWNGYPLVERLAID